MKNDDRVRSAITLWASRGLVTAAGLTASVSMAFSGKVSIPMVPGSQEETAERIEAVKSAITSLEGKHFFVPAPDSANQVKILAQWGNWPNWPNWPNWNNWNNWFNVPR